jgi:hypothetical protein
MNQKFLGKWLTPGLEPIKYNVSLERLIMPASDKVLKEWYRHVKRTSQPGQKCLSMARWRTTRVSR